MLFFKKYAPLFMTCILGIGGPAQASMFWSDGELSPPNGGQQPPTRYLSSAVHQPNHTKHLEVKVTPYYASNPATPSDPAPRLYSAFIARSAFHKTDVDQHLGALLYCERDYDPQVTDTLLQIAMDYEKRHFFVAERNGYAQPSLMRICDLLEDLIHYAGTHPDNLWFYYNRVLKAFPHASTLHRQAIQLMGEQEEDLHYKRDLVNVWFDATLQFLGNNHIPDSFDDISLVVSRICMHYWNAYPAKAHLDTVYGVHLNYPWTDPIPLLWGVLTTLRGSYLPPAPAEGQFSPYSFYAGHDQYSPSHPGYNGGQGGWDLKTQHIHARKDMGCRKKKNLEHQAHNKKPIHH